MANGPRSADCDNLAASISPEAHDNSLSELHLTQFRGPTPGDDETHDKCPQFFGTFVPVIA